MPVLKGKKFSANETTGLWGWVFHINSSREAMLTSSLSFLFQKFKTESADAPRAAWLSQAIASRPGKGGWPRLTVSGDSVESC